MILYWGIILAVCKMGVEIIQKLEPPLWRIRRVEGWFLIVCSGINAAVIFHISCGEGIREFLLAMFAGCLLFASTTDYKTYEVYQFVWWVAGIVGVMLLTRHSLLFDEMQTTKILTLLGYCLLQELFFAKFYGRADCHAFAVSAIVGCGMGMEFINYLNHMLFAFVGVAVVQAFRRNINKRGNLKRPVAFIPYITVSFWINLCCFSFEKMVY